jgi:hypothetical protein
MMTREMRQSCQITRIQEFKIETMKKRWRQERLWCGDEDATIWGGLNGVGSGAIEEQCNRGVERGKTERD